MSLRRLVSLTALVDFAALTVTAVVLYATPQGRIAYWADWRLWGLSKEQWTALHINLGGLFILASLLHIVYNWRSITLYLSNRRHRLKVWTPAFVTALLLATVFILGTLLQVAPFQWVIGYNEALKDQAARTYGEPPFNHAELAPLRLFAQRMDLDLDAVVTKLAAAGIAVTSPDETLKSIAARHRISPQRLYDMMHPAAPPPGSAGECLPSSPPPGTGRRLLGDICQEYGLPLEVALVLLGTNGIEARAGDTLRDIAARSGRHPDEIYALLAAHFAGKTSP